MKSSFRLIFAALAATMALACTKEPTPPNFENDKVAPASEGLRVIAVSFTPQTKTALGSDGLTPYFKKDDKILLCAEPEEPDTELKVDTCKVQIDSNGNPFITTDLEGDLSAVYPVTAVKKVKDEESGEEVMRIFIPSVQSGKFADANIVTGQIRDDSNEVTFEPNTALLRFYVDKSIGVKSIKVTGTTMSINDEEGDASHITTVTAPEGHTLDEVTDDPGGRLCYIAVPNDVNKNGVKFEIETTTQDKVEKTTEATGKFVKRKMYDVFIPYYVKVNVGTEAKPEYQCWAYCNIGAFLPEEPGQYFAWGDTKGYKWDAKNNQFEDGHWFDWKNCPFNNNTAYCVPIASVLAEICTNIEGTHYVLNPGYDAAYQKWGEKWRMPTSGDANKLFESTNTTGKDITGNVLTIHGSSLKIPVSGSSNSDNPTGDDGTVLTYYKEKGYLWTSSMSYNHSTDYYEPNYAMAVSFTTDNVSTTGMERKFGLPIRPIYCDPAPHESEDDSDLLSGKFSVGNKTIMFSKGNLYWDGSSYQFESNQYDYRQFNGIQGDEAVISGISGTTPENTVGTFWWVPNHLVDEYTKPYSEAPASNLGSRDDDIIFTNSNGTTANPEFTVNGKSGKYRTFTADEMAAILFDRTDECRFAKAQVMGVNGLFIFPDDYSLPSGYSTEGGVGMSAINNKTKPFPETNVPNDTWTKMESDGVVFLPAAGYRTSYFFSDIKVNGSGIGGYYWTNSLHGTGYNFEDATAGFMEFTGEDIDQNKNGYRKTGYSIRLVMDVSNN